MTITRPFIHDVVIAGAGPVGLFLACELRLADVSVLVLEQAVDPLSPLKTLPFGMRGLTVPTIEAFYRRDLLDEIVAAQHANDARGATKAAAHWMQQHRRAAGHFAGIQFFQDNIDRTEEVLRRDLFKEQLTLGGARHGNRAPPRPRCASGVSGEARGQRCPGGGGRTGAAIRISIASAG